MIKYLLNTHVEYGTSFVGVYTPSGIVTVFIRLLQDWYWDR